MDRLEALTRQRSEQLAVIARYENLPTHSTIRQDDKGYRKFMAGLAVSLAMIDNGIELARRGYDFGYREIV